MIVVVLNGKAGAKVRGPTAGASEEQLRGVLAGHGLDAKIVTTNSEDEARSAGGKGPSGSRVGRRGRPVADTQTHQA